MSISTIAAPAARRERRECRAHVVAQMTVRANEERQLDALDGRLFAVPSFSVV